MEKEEDGESIDNIGDKNSTYIPNVEEASLTSDFIDTDNSDFPPSNFASQNDENDDNDTDISPTVSVVISKENVLAFSRDDENLMISSQFTRVCHDRPISAVCYHPVMKRLLTCDNRTFRLWQMSKGDRLSPEKNQLELIGEVMLSGMAGMCFGLHMDPTISCFIAIMKGKETRESPYIYSIVLIECQAIENNSNKNDKGSPRTHGNISEALSNRRQKRSQSKKIIPMSIAHTFEEGERIDASAYHLASHSLVIVQNCSNEETESYLRWFSFRDLFSQPDEKNRMNRYQLILSRSKAVTKNDQYFVTSLIIDPRTDMMFGTQDTDITVWQVDTGEVLFRIEFLTAESILCLAVLPGSDLIATVYMHEETEQYMVHIWKITSDGSVISAVELPPFNKEIILIELIDVMSRYEKERGTICLFVTFGDNSKRIYMLSEDFDSIKYSFDYISQSPNEKQVGFDLQSIRFQSLHSPSFLHDYQFILLYTINETVHAINIHPPGGSADGVPLPGPLIDHKMISNRIASPYGTDNISSELKTQHIQSNFSRPSNILLCMTQNPASICVLDKYGENIIHTFLLPKDERSFQSIETNPLLNHSSDYDRKMTPTAMLYLDTLGWCLIGWSTGRMDVIDIETGERKYVLKPITSPITEDHDYTSYEKTNDAVKVLNWFPHYETTQEFGTK